MKNRIENLRKKKQLEKKKRNQSVFSDLTEILKIISNDRNIKLRRKNTRKNMK